LCYQAQKDEKIMTSTKTSGSVAISQTKKPTTRRKFLKGGAIAAGAAASTLAFPNIATAAPRVLKVQAAWGGLPFWVICLSVLTLVFYDFWDTCLRKKLSH
jgi:sterol desaturase/sphingolipid hydroxylase (fatty acid hydroxylase superfamily)